MRRHLRAHLVSLALAGFVLVLSACSGGASEQAATSYTAAEVQDAAATAMAAIESVHFDVTRSGADVTIDDTGLVVFESASGRFAAPRSADAVVAVDLMGNRVELGAVALDGVLYLTDPLTGAWQDATGTIDFDPATIFSVDEGIAAVLASGMADTSLRTAEPDDDGLLHLTGTVSPDDVATLTSGLVSEPATAEVSIDAATSLVRTITFDTPLDNGVASWLVELSDYGADVTIEPPDLGDG